MAEQSSAQIRAARTSDRQEVVLLNWNKASDTVLNGKGAWFNGGRPTQLLIQSTFSKGEWKRPSNFTFTNWKLNGSIRILGVGSSASDAVRQSSFRRGHTERMQAAAPTGITLSGLTIKADEKIPLILGPGVNNVTLRDSTLAGTSQSVAIYLDAESAYNTIADNTFTIKADRELIAVDGSKGNQISGNTFKNLPWGGVYVYRNCGERGVVRHQKPTHNQITDNIFDLSTLKSFWEKNPKNGRQLEYRHGIWLGSREGSRAPDYCGEDKGYPFGSSISNGDFADDNIVSGNRRIGSNKGYLLKLSEDLGIGGYDKFIKDDGTNNQIQSNRAFDARPRRLSAAPSAGDGRASGLTRTGTVSAPVTASIASPAPMPVVRNPLARPGALEQHCGCSSPQDFRPGLSTPAVA